MGVKRRLVWLLIVVGMVVLLDQLTKQVASQSLSPLISSIHLNGLVRFVYAENTGILKSIGHHLPEVTKRILFTLAPALIFFALLIYVLLKRQISRWNLLGYALVIGGGLSNLIDRLINNGAVIDFIYLAFWGFMTDIFNLADLAITTGCLLLILQILSGRSRKPPSINRV